MNSENCIEKRTEQGMEHSQIPCVDHSFVCVQFPCFYVRYAVNLHVVI